MRRRWCLYRGCLVFFFSARRRESRGPWVRGVSGEKSDAELVLDGDAGTALVPSDGSTCLASGSLELPFCGSSVSSARRTGT